MNPGSIPGRENIFFSATQCSNRLLSPLRTLSSFSGGKSDYLEAYHSYSFGAEVKNLWSYNFTPPHVFFEQCWATTD
jgi:hypothetical protein